MSSTAQPESSFQPKFGWWIAFGIFTVAAVAFLYPMFTGLFLAGSDQVHAGYAFRAVAANAMQQQGHIPQWNPYIFGGMPLWAVPGHFDVFYPTAWLRWFMAADRALDWGFFLHLIVAGLAMYALLRTLRASWTAAVVAGLAYEFSGILASQVSPGHDGKLYAAALSPFALAALIRAIRGNQLRYYGWFALVIGLVLLTPHYLAAYYLLIASALFTLWLVFMDEERLKSVPVIRPLACTAIAVLLGFGVAMIELMPVQHMVNMTARAAGGASTGYDYASSWGMNPTELMTTILPQFNGMLLHYWGENQVKDHTEYLGVVVVMLMLFGVAAAARRRMLLPFAVTGVLFTMVAWGGYSPFYHLWVLLPRMGQFRAPGLAFFVVALMVCVLAGLGVDDLLALRVKRTFAFIVIGVLGLIALLASVGALQGIAEGLAIPQRVEAVLQNAGELQSGGVRMLIAVLCGGAAILLIMQDRLRGMFAAVTLLVIIGVDNWSILRNFPNWLPPASVSFGDDAVTSALKKTPLPFRVYSPYTEAESQINALTVYPNASLMSRGLMSLLGYHGMESRYFDDLLGVKNIWQYQYSPTLWDLFAVRYIVQTQEQVGIPGYHKLMGPTELSDMQPLIPATATEAYVFERDSATQWVRIIPAAAKIPEQQIPPTVSNPAFPLASYVVFPDSSAIKAETPSGSLPAPATVSAALASWKSGEMTVKLTGSDPRTTYLVVSENWYPDWHATVDGKPVAPLRGDGALITVPIPTGARDVSLKFDIESYHTGTWVSIVALLLIAGLIGADTMRRRAADG